MSSYCFSSASSAKPHPSSRQSSQQLSTNADCSACSNCNKQLDIFPKYALLKAEVLGQGGFGSVIKGQLTISTAKGPTKVVPVVVKMLHGPVTKKGHAVMQEMCNLKHRNLIQFMGIVENDSFDCPELIFRPASDRSLLHYIRGMNNFDAEVLNKIALDVINGMEYLHSKNFVHGCLAARNVLLDELRGHKNGKICDYGMNRVIPGVGANYFTYAVGKSVPIRWLPKESLPALNRQPEIETSADVWSFGVLLWEIWTKGEVPYGSSASNSDVKQYIMNGSSPLAFRRPEECGGAVMHMMQNILNSDASKRPTFEILNQMFSAIVTPTPINNLTGASGRNQKFEGHTTREPMRGNRGRSRGRGRAVGVRRGEKPSDDHQRESRSRHEVPYNSLDDSRATLHTRRTEFQCTRPPRRPDSGHLRESRGGGRGSRRGKYDGKQENQYQQQIGAQESHEKCPPGLNRAQSYKQRWQNTSNATGGVGEGSTPPPCTGLGRPKPLLPTPNIPPSLMYNYQSVPPPPSYTETFPQSSITSVTNDLQKKIDALQKKVQRMQVQQEKRENVEASAVKTRPSPRNDLTLTEFTSATESSNLDLQDVQNNESGKSAADLVETKPLQTMNISNSNCADAKASKIQNIESTHYSMDNHVTAKAPQNMNIAPTHVTTATRIPEPEKTLNNIVIAANTANTANLRIYNRETSVTSKPLDPYQNMVSCQYITSPAASVATAQFTTTSKLPDSQKRVNINFKSTPAPPQKMTTNPCTSSASRPTSQNLTTTQFTISHPTARTQNTTFHPRQPKENKDNCIVM